MDERLQQMQRDAEKRRAELGVNGITELGVDQTKTEAVNHPRHYGGADNVYETIKVIEAWGLGFTLGNAVKYISRAGKKDGSREGMIEDLRKAEWYLCRALDNLVDGKQP